jgi:transposase-like protein
MSKGRRSLSPSLKFQIVLETLTGGKTPGQVAKAYGVHPNTVGLWKKALLERGPEIFSRDGTIHEYERRIGELEQLIGKKEVEIALLKNFLGRPR